MMNIYTTRGSVAAGDDGDAPHGRHFALPDGTSLREVLKHIQAVRYLPSISGGQATWSVASNRPLAVLAQQWAEPKMVATVPENMQGLVWKEGTLSLHFNYHAQIDPDSVYRVLWGYRLNAS
jgi:hypothetical protein